MIKLYALLSSNWFQRSLKVLLLVALFAGFIVTFQSRIPTRIEQAQAITCTEDTIKWVCRVNESTVDCKQRFIDTHPNVYANKSLCEALDIPVMSTCNTVCDADPTQGNGVCACKADCTIKSTVPIGQTCGGFEEYCTKADADAGTRKCQNGFEVVCGYDANNINRVWVVAQPRTTCALTSVPKCPSINLIAFSTSDPIDLQRSGLCSTAAEGGVANRRYCLSGYTAVQDKCLTADEIVNSGNLPPCRGDALVTQDKPNSEKCSSSGNILYHCKPGYYSPPTAGTQPTCVQNTGLEPSNAILLSSCTAACQNNLYCQCPSGCQNTGLIDRFDEVRTCSGTNNSLPLCRPNQNASFDSPGAQQCRTESGGTSYHCREGYQADGFGKCFLITECGDYQSETQCNNSSDSFNCKWTEGSGCGPASNSCIIANHELGNGGVYTLSTCGGQYNTQYGPVSCQPNQKVTYTCTNGTIIPSCKTSTDCNATCPSSSVCLSSSTCSAGGGTAQSQYTCSTSGSVCCKLPTTETNYGCTSSSTPVLNPATQGLLYCKCPSGAQVQPGTQCPAVGGSSCNNQTGTPYSVDPGGQCCGGGVVECKTGICGATEGQSGTCQAASTGGGGSGAPTGEGKGQGETCANQGECASPLTCGDPCPSNTLKPGQRVCFARNGYLSACGGLNVEGRVCNSLDRGACGSCGNGSPLKQPVCNALGTWDCLTTDRCGATGDRPNCPAGQGPDQCPGSICIYDSTCANGWCDLQGGYVCRDLLGSSSDCERPTQCRSNVCTNGKCVGDIAPASCGSYQHGKFMGCGNKYTNPTTNQPYPSDYDCFCYNGVTSCAYDADKQSCGAPAGPVTTPQPTPAPTSIPPQGYFCNSDCTSDAECQTENPNFYCHDRGGDNPSRCRLRSNPTSNLCQPAGPGPQCLKIEMINVSQNQRNGTTGPTTGSPQLGDVVRFRCGQVPGVAKYRFRIFKTDGSKTNLTDVAEGSDRTSETITIDKPGRYYAQCTICTGQDNSTCHAYPPVDLTPDPDPTTPPAGIACNSDCTTDAQCVGALGAGYICKPREGDNPSRCRLATNPTDNTCKPVVTVPAACNDDCSSDAQCKALNANWYCHLRADGPARCRLQSSPNDNTCGGTTAALKCNSDCTTDAECVGALGAGYICKPREGDNPSRCRLATNPTDNTCTALATNPQVCNDNCKTDAECKAALGTAYKCHLRADGPSRCRLTANPTDNTCTTFKCNQDCTTDAQCQTGNPLWYCHPRAVGEPSRCRLRTSPNDNTCALQTATGTSSSGTASPDVETQ